jgi:hypothetical protein
MSGMSVINLHLSGREEPLAYGRSPVVRCGVEELGATEFQFKEYSNIFCSRSDREAIIRA